MKKFLLFILITLPQIFSIAFAEDSAIYNLHTNNAYILELTVRPMDLQITNNSIIKAEVVTDIFTTNSQMVITTFDEGISYITYKSNNKPYTIKILVDNKANVDLLEIDKPKEN